MWVFGAATLGASTSIIAGAIGVKGPITLLITTSLVATLVFIFSVDGEILGGASFNPTGTAAFYAADFSKDSLFSMALRFPAQVTSIRESRSDDKRFSIFTGTKRLHLRAECREDRTAWMDALQAVKDMFPLISNNELMAPENNFAVSTEKSKQRLQEEGVSEAAVQDSEQSMRNEFAALQSQLMLLKQKQWQLIDTLRHLEYISDWKTLCQ